MKYELRIPGNALYNDERASLFLISGKESNLLREAIQAKHHAPVPECVEASRLPIGYGNPRSIAGKDRIFMFI